MVRPAVGIVSVHHIPKGFLISCWTLYLSCYMQQYVFDIMQSEFPQFYISPPVGILGSFIGTGSINPGLSSFLGVVTLILRIPGFRSCSLCCCSSVGGNTVLDPDLHPDANPLTIPS